MAISVEEALERVLAHTTVLEEEWVSLQDALGRTVTRNIRSPMLQPPFDRSPLDGYARIAADTVGASAQSPACLQVVDKLYAGDTSRVPVQPGQAVRLMTGGMVPAGADCVIRQEDTDEGETTVRVYREMKANSNICYRGEEYGFDDLLIPAGQVVDAAAVAVAAGAGQTQLPVRRRPRVAILSTGDEVQQPGQTLKPGKIYDSNTAYLTARLHQFGAEIVASGTAGDNLDVLLHALREYSQTADIVLTTGGVSVGQKDLTEAALEAVGAKIVFHGMAMKPGMPTLFAVKDDTLFLGLSGNPFSAAVPFELLLRPMLGRMTENTELYLKRESVIAGNDFPKRSPSRRFVRSCCKDGVVAVPGKQGNGQMRSMIGCNCLIDIPAGSDVIRQGERVEIVWL